MTYLNQKEIPPVDRDKIWTQVEQICSTAPFKRSEKLSSFLKFIIAEYLEGKGEFIKAYTVAVEVFDRSDSFDPQNDSIVRVYGSKLRRELDNYYQANGNPDEVLISMPKGSYIPLIQFKEEMGHERPASSNQDRVRNNLRENISSIGVVIFKCLSENEKCNFISNGLSEEIVIELGLFKELKVKGPLRREYLDEKRLDLKGIGSTYGVRFVLDGSLRISENMLRLTVRLNETRNGEQLWGNVLECDLNKDSIAEFEKEVIRNTVSTIADNYGVISRYMRKDLPNNPAENSSTYEAILKYYNHFIVLTGESQVDATLALENALEKEPDNATTMAMLGDLVASTYQFGYSDEKDLLIRAKKLGRRSIQLDSNCQAAHFLMGLIYFLEGRKDSCFEEFEIALKLNPNNAHYIAAISLFFGMAGDWEQGVSLMDRACMMNPHYPGWHHLVYFMDFYRKGKYDLALREASDFNTPEYYMDPLIRAAVFGKLNRKAMAKKEVLKLLALMPDFLENGRNRMKRFFFSDEHLDIMWDGLVKAGLTNS